MFVQYLYFIYQDKVLFFLAFVSILISLCRVCRDRIQRSDSFEVNLCFFSNFQRKISMKSCMCNYFPHNNYTYLMSLPPECGSFNCGRQECLGFRNEQPTSYRILQDSRVKYTSTLPLLKDISSKSTV